MEKELWEERGCSILVVLLQPLLGKLEIEMNYSFLPPSITDFFLITLDSLQVTEISMWFYY
jgi:hypothetical protein